MTLAMHEPAAAAAPGADPTVTLADARARLRREERTPIRVHAILHVAPSFQPTVITDISRSGAGLDGANGVFPGARVRIELLSGEACEGIVRWWQNGRCGVQFATPLTTEGAFQVAIARRTAKRRPEPDRAARGR